MDVIITKEGSKTHVQLIGRIDTTNASKFLEDIQPLMDDKTPDIELDCSQMDYTSSQGLRIFLMLQKSVNAHQGKLVMKNMNLKVKEVFDITGFSSIITII